MKGTLGNLVTEDKEVNEVDEMIEIMNGELNKVFLWLNSNKLSLNVKKTAIRGV